jgi:hypothetical protein
MSTKTYRLMRALILANVLSAAAVSAASATDGPPPGEQAAATAMPVRLQPVATSAPS